MGRQAVFITGSGGYLGSLVMRELSARAASFDRLVAHDLKLVADEKKLPGITYLQGDIRSDDFDTLFARYRITTVVHLASLVTPPKNSSPEMEYEVDVLGTRRVLQAALKNHVRHFIITSSGAAYGYHADNAEWLSEDDPLRGNDEFPYSRHKRLVEELLLNTRQENPELKQLILRPGTILGTNTNNQITNLFHQKFVLGICGSKSPFVFIWDKDVVAIIVRGIEEEKTGIYNLAGSGSCSMRLIAEKLHKPYLCMPAGILKISLSILHRLKLTRYGANQLDFLRYRPVLSNQKLVNEFGFTPTMSSEAVFDFFIEHNLKKIKT